ncbi:hypothetical protein EGT74_05735 [Chitinophaga lutea]|uniref:Uncharacterized protein n=1 Tax=Chitinophaga lutea TaxID=2488634 RepID=A0A3N4PYK9_9BACT|nr:hypothetical protein EGT74_05735 [Chitinophaga lutea]
MNAAADVNAAGGTGRVLFYFEQTNSIIPKEDFVRLRLPGGGNRRKQGKHEYKDDPSKAVLLLGHVHV